MASNSSPLLKMTSGQRWQLVGLQLALLGLLFQELSVYLLAIMALCVLWQIAIAKGMIRLPKVWLVQTVALVCCVLLLLLGQQLGLLLAMIHLMCFSYVLKCLQIFRRKDFFLVILQGYFLIAGVLIFYQDIIIVFGVLMLFLLNTSLLAHVILPKLSFQASFRQAGKLMVISLPLTIGLFVLFPKLPPFWQVPLAKSAKTGLSDVVQPGDIANLVQSDALVFRALFKNGVPGYSQLYWRALVLDDYDGRKWQKSQQLRQLDQHYVSLRSKDNLPQINREFSYQIIAEASYQPWLYLLGDGESDHEEVVRLPAARMVKKTQLTQTFSYDVYSQLSKSEDDHFLLSFWRRQFTAIPIDANPRLFQWARNLVQQYPDPDTLVQQIGRHIQSSNYFYTLQPPQLSNNSLDEFFFDTRAGFCEHYASATAFALRAAGIPARLVTGYLGAELNPETGHYAVFQYDAHAWLEYWTATHGWKRFDPTAMVSPERVLQGLNQALSNEDALFVGGALSLSQYRNIALLNYLRLKLDALDYQWTKWVLNYSVDQQQSLLKRLLGKGHIWKNSLLIAGALLLTLFIAWYWLRQSQKIKYAEHVKLMKALIVKVNRYQPLYLQGMTFIELAAVIATRYPKLKMDWQTLTGLYHQLQYQSLTAENHKELSRQFKQQAKLLLKADYR